MSTDRTEQQSTEHQEQAQELSLRRTRPPTEVPGYEIQQFLGSGAYGEVWAGVDRTTRRRVAIKFYRHRSGLDWSLLDQETEKLVFLSADRYVVQLLNVGWEANPPYYVMEYVENGSLDDHLRERGSLPVAEAVEIFHEVAVGLMHAHGKGVLHCDLKPGNILLDTDHKPRLADFGQSRLSNDQTPALGTLFYMAPEQADLDAVPDVRWDVYALGAILYAMVTGSPPHRSQHALTKIDTTATLGERLSCYRALIRSSSAPTDHHRVRGVDRALREIVDRCLAVDFHRRYSNVQEVLDALRARAAARHRRPLVMLGIAGPLLLLAIMSIFGWRGYEEATKATNREVRAKVHESNQLAARFAATALSREIERYFEIGKDEVAAPDFRQPFMEVAGGELVRQLGVQGLSPAEAESIRERFNLDPKRAWLKRHLAERLAHFLREFEQDPRKPKFASILVTDAQGIILSVAYDQEGTESKSVGRNFSRRTYFHGGPDDLPEGQTPPVGQHVRGPHLSAPFSSTTTQLWRVAISIPIYAEPDPENRRTPDDGFLGVLAFTVNVGDFEFMRNKESLQDRFAVLIDGRAGGRQGTILQHPLFEEQRGKDYTKYRVSSDVFGKIRTDPQYSYRDPLGETDEGRRYGGDWIAALEGVPLPNGDHGAVSKRESDLVVLVQERATVATHPVDKLSRRLVREGLTALGVVLATIVVLWSVVLGQLREPGSTPTARRGHGERTERRSRTTLPPN